MGMSLARGFVGGFEDKSFSSLTFSFGAGPMEAPAGPHELRPILKLNYLTVGRYDGNTKFATGIEAGLSRWISEQCGLYSTLSLDTPALNGEGVDARFSVGVALIPMGAAD